MKEYKAYLKDKVAPSTAKRYVRELELYFDFLAKREVVALGATYQEIMEYMGYLREKPGKTKGKTKVPNAELQAIKKYYYYLCEAGLRTDHPAASIRLRDKINRDIQLQDLFTSKELSELLDRKERYKDLKMRNLVILSLLIYQGLRNGECCRIILDDIHLQSQTIYIKSSRKSNSRSLKLQENQVLWLMDYLSTDRRKLLAISGLRSNKLLLTSRGTEEQGEGISYLIGSSQKLFATRILNARTIRQSVIANKLSAGQDLREVQVFAGHKYADTTEKYRQNHVESLKTAIHRYHPNY